MAETAVRVLVVDDFELFRRFVASILGNQPGLQVICEVSDGLEAVHKAEELQPDLIVLDLGLPKLNGIEAARQIRELSPKSRILFLSQESSAAVVQEAFSVGAWGYVVKADAGSELLTAVNTVIRGQRFVGSRFAGHDFTDVLDSQAPDGRAESLESTAPTLPRNRTTTRSHEVHFYSDDALFLDGFTQYVGTALKNGNVIIVATELHRDSLLARLQADGLEIADAIQQGRYVSSDAADMLWRLMVNDVPDPDRFLKIAGDLIMATAKAGTIEHSRVAVCRECAPLLWTQAQAEAAIRIEQLWDEMARAYDVDILCGYQRGSFHGEQGSHLFRRLCAEHSAVRSL